jgi:hypothetical protein
MPARRARRQFPFDGDALKVALEWARLLDYTIVSQTDDALELRRGLGFFAAPRVVSVQVSGEQVTVEAWIRINIIARIGALFLLPAEITVESGGIQAALPRKLGRDDVDKLLKLYGQPTLG